MLNVKRSPLKKMNDGPGKKSDNSSPIKKVCPRALPVITNDNENKENANPLDFGMEDSDDDCRDDSSFTDGFAVTEDLELDNTESETDKPEDDSSPLLKSVIFNKMLKLDTSTTLKLSAGQDGCSPALKLNQDSRDSTPSKNVDGIFKFRRSVSMVDRPTLTSPDLRKPVSAIEDFTSPVSRTTFKRPIPLDNHLLAKRLRTGGGQSASCSSGSPAISSIFHSFSLADTSNLTADRAATLSLPTIQGASKNHDLNNIDVHVMAKLLNGDFDDKVSSFRVIDARYKYEFEGGHIRGAENFGLWEEKSFFDEFFPAHLGPRKPHQAKVPAAEPAQDRHILIFHCEFSSARGPALLRALRKKDREVNGCNYPMLHYPECYLLHNGYKEFFAHYPHLCEPQAYISMAHPDYIHEERKFHRKSKTWAGGGNNTVARTGASSRLLKL